MFVIYDDQSGIDRFVINWHLIIVVDYQGSVILIFVQRVLTWFRVLDLYHSSKTHPSLHAYLFFFSFMKREE